MRSRIVETALEKLPIQRGYHDIWGNFFEPTEEGVRGILRALRFDPDHNCLEQLVEWERKRASEVLPPAIVLRGAERRWQIKSSGRAVWALKCETGEMHSGVAINGAIQFPETLPQGYHHLELVAEGRPYRARVIVCPATAFAGPPSKSWGLSVQLYSVYSGESEGIGDFRDLASLCSWTSRQGGAFVGINPLHALFPRDPIGYSPYSPSSRMALNPLYVRLAHLPEFQPEDLRSREVLLSRSSELLNYPEIVERKFQILARCHTRLAGSSGERREEFAKFLQSAPAHLRKFAEHTARADSNYPDPEFHLYCQWIADRQLKEVVQSSGLDVGLYLDLAVGVNPQGAEVWEDPELFAPLASAGAPPDLLNVQGQVWGLAPYIPWELRARAYEPFIQTLRFNMQYAGALRIDHIMCLQRLFWVPQGMSGRDGIYLQYPLSDLMGIVALESQRNRCIVIGEDLGTVPDEIRAEMNRSGVLSYKVLYFMKDYQGDGGYLKPESYPEQALVAGSTHDLPTLRGFLRSQDLEVRKPLGLFSETCTYEGEKEGRAKDRENLVAMLRAMNFSVGNDEEILESITKFLSLTKCRLQTIQIEDLIGELDQANLPGTVTEHPNWRRRLGRSLENILFDEKIAEGLKTLRR